MAGGRQENRFVETDVGVAGVKLIGAWLVISDG